MRNCRANTYKLWYVNCVANEPIIDKNGDSTGEYEDKYNTPVFFRANISPSRGEAWEAPYGLNFQYDNILSTAEQYHDIDETTYIFESEPPIINGQPDITKANYRVVGVMTGHMHNRYALRKMRHEG